MSSLLFQFLMFLSTVPRYPVLCVVRYHTGRSTSVNSFITDVSPVMRTSKFFNVGLLAQNLTDLKRVVELPGGLMH